MLAAPGWGRSTGRRPAVGAAGQQGVGGGGGGRRIRSRCSARLRPGCSSRDRPGVRRASGHGVRRASGHSARRQSRPVWLRWALGARHVHLNVMLDGLAVLVSRCSAAGCDARGYGSGRESVGGPRRIDFATRGGVHFTAGGRSKSRAGESGSGPARQGVCPARRTVASTQTSHDQAIGEASARA